MAEKLSKLHILHEDNHLIVVNKPPGILTQSDKTRDRTIADQVKGYIGDKYNKPGKVYLGIPHRLDRPVGGVLVLARTSKAHERMVKLFRDRDVEKEYIALVDTLSIDKKKLEKLKISDEGKLDLYQIKNSLTKDTERNISRVVDRGTPGSKEAVLSFSIGLTKKQRTALHIFPKTGRPHQIRVQLASIGLPIIGDLKYGYSRPNRDKNICLASRVISFMHPVKKEPLKAEIGIPPSWRF